MKPKRVFTLEDFKRWGALGGAKGGLSKSPKKQAALLINASKARKAYILARRQANALARRSS